MQAAMEEPVAEPSLEELDVARLDELQADEEIWELARIAEEFKVARITVDSWRNKSLKYIRDDKPVPTLADALPEPDLVYSRAPLWKAGTVRTWGMRTGRMLPDGTPVRSKPPGRPRNKPGDPSWEAHQQQRRQKPSRRS